MMTGTHAYYNTQHFRSKCGQEEQSDEGSCPSAGMSVNMEDSFGDLLDNDTSERHIVVQSSPAKKAPPAKQERPKGLPQNLMQAQLHQARMGSSSGKSSLAKPLPSATASATPG